MPENVSHKRIAKNTIALYVRGLISVVVSLFTSRVVIDTLGVDDYGVYGVAGGFVGILAFLNASMAGATSRFITYEMGLGDQERVKKTFANALGVHIAIAVIILIICEAVGVWFLNTQLNIPAESMEAANWIFQLSILTTCISITQVPYSALIISHEKMSIYAYLEITNVILKLIIVYFLIILPGNKLIIYGILTTLVSLLVALAYRAYCLQKFKESRTGPKYDKGIVLPMLSFSGWDMYGNLCVTANNQGITFILNIFFGVAINGAASIATVLTNTISGFSNNIIMAFRPQIIKNYAQKSFKLFQNLLTRATQLSTMLLIMMAIPFIIETPFIFSLWLGDVPEWVVPFSRIIIFSSIIGQINSVLGIGIHATGNIKQISFISGSFFLLNLPIVWLFFKLDSPPYMAFVISLVIVFIVMLINISILHMNVSEFQTKSYLGKIIKLPFLSLPAFLICFILHNYMTPGFLRLFIVCVCSLSIILFSTIYFILSKQERVLLFENISRRFKINRRDD